MIYSTGVNSDFFVFELALQGFDTWSDFGGQDVLIMSEYQFDPFRSFVNTGTSIVVSMFGTELTIPHDPFNVPSVEYLEWRQLVNQPGQTPAVNAFLKIITDLNAVTGTDIAVIGTNAGETIRAPEYDTVQTGFSEIYAAGGGDHITLSSTMSFRAFGGNGMDDIRAKGSVDTFISGDNGADKLIGAGGDDVIFGGKGNDIIKGHGGNDSLFGDDFGFFPFGGGDDRINGGRGNDIISGGGGDDILTGGRGQDQFEFAIFHIGVDRITDFNAARDSIHFDTDTVPGQYSVRVNNGNTHLRFKGDTFVVLENVELTLSDITMGFL